MNYDSEKVVKAMISKLHLKLVSLQNKGASKRTAGETKLMVRLREAERRLLEDGDDRRAKPSRESYSSEQLSVHRDLRRRLRSGEYAIAAAARSHTGKR